VQQTPLSIIKVNGEGGMHLKIGLIKYELVNRRCTASFVELRFAW
jgi:hypothetical protein